MFLEPLGRSGQSAGVLIGIKESAALPRTAHFHRSDHSCYMITTNFWDMLIDMSNLPQNVPIAKTASPLDEAGLTLPPARGDVASRAGCPFNELRGKLRGAGLRPTRQRVSLGWLLFAKGDRHVSAEMLFDEATRARVPVSLATVYNTLHQFTEAGLLRELAVDGAKTYFDTNPTDHHHFFVEGEEAMIDLPLAAVSIDSLPQPPEGMEIARVDVIVRLRRKAV